MIALRPARPEDVGLILRFIRELAAYERLEHEVVATEALLTEHLFGAAPKAEVVLAEHARPNRGEGPDHSEPVGFALFFHNFSTFLGRPGIYLEDLYVTPAARGQGVARALLVHLARLAKTRACGRMEWAVLDWNEPARRFYRSLGARFMDDWVLTRLTGEALDALAEEGPGDGAA